MRKFNGSREAFSAALLDLAESDERVMFVSSDSIKAMRATEFGKNYPGRYIECGIAEQGAVDVAAGLACCGKVPFIGTYCGFLTMRACEQMRTFVGYTDLNVKFFGVNAGLLGGEREGVTHQFYEDLGIVSSLPNFRIFTPADPFQCYHAVKYAASVEGPVYIRGGSGREVNVFSEEDPFAKNGITVMRDYGKDAVLFSNGYVLDRVIAAADLLNKDGIKVTVADINILYGEDNSAIISAVKLADHAFAVEDHNINGGLGSYLSRLRCECCPGFVHRIALNSYGESGPAKVLADHYGFSPEAIVEKVKKEL